MTRFTNTLERSFFGRKAYWIALIFIFGLTAPHAGAESGYREGRLPFQCFMKNAMDWTSEELDLASSKISACDQYPREAGNASEALEAGKQLYNAHKKAVDELIADFETHITSPLPAFDEKRLADLRASTKIPDFKYCRNLSRGLKLIAFSFFRQGEPEKALKLLLLIYRFGQHLLAGDGSYPIVIQGMIGVAVKNIALTVLAGEILAKGTLEAKFLDHFAATCDRLAKEEPSFMNTLKCEFALPLNYIADEFWNSQTLFDETIDQSAVKLQEQVKKETKDRKAATEKMGKILRESHEAFWKACADKQADLFVFREQCQKHAQNLQKGIEPEMQKKLDPVEGVANYLAWCSFPNVAKAWENVCINDLRLKGAAAAARLAKALKSGTPRPASAEALKKILEIPADPFAKGTPPCLLKIDPQSIVLYSVGPNNQDDGGDPTTDIILLFR